MTMFSCHTSFPRDLPQEKLLARATPPSLIARLFVDSVPHELNFFFFLFPFFFFFACNNKAMKFVFFYTDAW